MTARKRRPQKPAKKGPTRRPKRFAVKVRFREGGLTHAYTTRKREAIRLARRLAYGTHPKWHVPRQVSVYEEEGTERPTLIYQVHYSVKLARLIAEEL